MLKDIGRCSMRSMVLTIDISVSFFRIAHHLIRPFEEGFVLNLFQDLMHGFSEYSSGLIGPISISYWVWAAICDLTIGAVCGEN